MRTSLPCSNSRRVTMPPTIPVAPTTRIIILLLVGYLHRVVRSCSLTSFGNALHGFIDILTVCFDWFNVQPTSHDASVTYPEEGHPLHVQPRGAPPPLAPHGFLARGVPEQPCLEIGEASNILEQFFRT